jgi:hypothetical protein
LISKPQLVNGRKVIQHTQNLHMFLYSFS